MMMSWSGVVSWPVLRSTRCAGAGSEWWPVTVCPGVSHLSQFSSVHCHVSPAHPSLNTVSTLLTWHPTTDLWPHLSCDNYQPSTGNLLRTLTLSRPSGHWFTCKQKLLTDRLSLFTWIQSFIWLSGSPLSVIAQHLPHLLLTQQWMLHTACKWTVILTLPHHHHHPVNPQHHHPRITLSSLRKEEENKQSLRRNQVSRGASVCRVEPVCNIMYGRQCSSDTIT